MLGRETRTRLDREGEGKRDIALQSSNVPRSLRQPALGARYASGRCFDRLIQLHASSLRAVCPWPRGDWHRRASVGKSRMPIHGHCITLRHLARQWLSSPTAGRPALIAIRCLSGMGLVLIRFLIVWHSGMRWSAQKQEKFQEICRNPNVLCRWPATVAHGAHNMMRCE